MTFPLKKTASRRRERGQTMLIAVVAMLILILAVFILFDVNSVIRGKVKAQNGVDAAAIVGANWQKHTLNLVGELNMVKACSVLISDDVFGIGADPSAFLSISNRDEFAAADAQRYSSLKTASDTLSQMQLRMLFLGPLVGFGAAQQAAKNNGITSNAAYAEAMTEQLNMVRGLGERASIYAPYQDEDFVKKNLFGFNWRFPYLTVLNEIMMDSGDGAKGVAVLCNAQLLGVPKIFTEGNPDVDFSSFLQQKRIYEAISSNYWCWLADLLKMDYGANGSKWWGELRLGTSNSFRGESEFLPVNVELRDASVSTYNTLNSTGLLDQLMADSGKDYGQKLGDLFDTTNPLYDDKGNVVVTGSNDSKLNPLPVIDWAYYGYRWRDYSSSVDKAWSGYLKTPFLKRAKYFSGAVSRMDAELMPVTVSGNMGVGEKRDSSSAYLGDAFDKVNQTTVRRASARMRRAEEKMRMGPPRIYAYSVAKPYGWISLNGEDLPPHYSGIVLPVFRQTALIPSSLENPGRNPLADYEWYQFLLRYLPALGTVGSFNDLDPALQTEFSYYHTLLRDKLSDPAWRQQGLDWLAGSSSIVKSVDKDTGEITYMTNEESCTFMGSSSGGSSWPSSFH